MMRLQSAKAWGAALLLAVSFLGLTLGGLYAVHHSRSIDAKLCENGVDNREAIRATWNAAREVFLTQTEQPEAVNAFFDDILKPIPPLECVNNQPVPKEG